MNGKKEFISGEKLKIMTEASKRNLQSISGMDLIRRVLTFDARLQALIDNQLMPPVLIIGALMGHVHRLQSREMVIKTDDAFETVIEFIDKNFVTKKEFNRLAMYLKEKYEEKPFKAKVE